MPRAPGGWEPVAWGANHGPGRGGNTAPKRFVPHAQRRTTARAPRTAVTEMTPGVRR